MKTYQDTIKRKMGEVKKPVLAEKFNSRTTSYVIDDIRVYAVVLDMDTVDPISTPIRFKQYDFGTSFLNIQLMEGEQPLNLRGLNVCGSFKVNDTGVIVNGTLSSQSIGKIVIGDEGIVKVPVPKEILRHSGFVECEIILFNEDGDRATSPRLSFNIQESLINHEKVSGDLPNSDNYPLLITLMNNVNTLHYNAEELLSKATVLHDTMHESEQIRVSQENDRQESIKNMQKSIDSKITEIDNAKNNMETYLSDKVDELHTHIDTSIQQEFTTVQSQVDTKITEVNNKITDINNTKLELVTNVNKKIEEVSNSEATLTSKVNLKITEVDTAKNEMVEDVTTAVSKVDTTISAIQNQFDALTEEVQLARTDVEGVTHASLNERLRKIETISSIIWEDVEG